MFIVEQSDAATAYIHISIKSNVPDNTEKYCNVSYSIPRMNENTEQ